MAAHELIEVDAADFLFSLENDLDVHRQAPVLFQVRLDGLQVHEHLTFVVGRPAREYFAVANRRFEWRRFPELERIDGLHVVVAIKQNGRRAGGTEPVAVHNRVARRIDQPDVLETDAPHLVGAPLGAPLHIRRMLGQRADAWDSQERFELREIAIAVDVDEVDDVIHVEPFS